MKYKKRILCLANSRKMSGRCVAGREIFDDGAPGAWVRPVSARPHQEISEEDRSYEDGETAQVGDIIYIPMKRHVPNGYQPENHLIDDGFYWAKDRVARWAEITAAAEMVNGPIWLNGFSSYNGLNDRVPLAESARLDRSLWLLEPNTLSVWVGVEGGGLFPAKRAVRAHFRVGNASYQLKVTDPSASKQLLAKSNGKHTFPAGTLLCISLGEPFEGFAYKLVATILEPNEG
ncbi:MAG: hypothetical protein GVY36_00255 [Verrucomicrobia bacterium]|jgi:hypothetical protein|nr:hypothetical protein [Verrucomicrobiota bacterium]